MIPCGAMYRNTLYHNPEPRELSCKNVTCFEETNRMILRGYWLGMPSNVPHFT